MTTEPEQQSKLNLACDLSELENFSFQPKWGRSAGGLGGQDNVHSSNRKREFRPIRDFNCPQSNNSGSFSGRISNNSKNKFQRQTCPLNRDDKKERATSEGFKRNFRPSDRGNRFRKQKKLFFRPAVLANFYAEDAIVDLVLQILNSSIKTYELFNVARLFLERSERFAVVLKRLDTKTDVNLYLCTADAAMFLNEAGAVEYVLKTHLDKYFDITEEAVEPPSGNFTCVHKCGLTGKLLCAPNYHKYNEIINRHFEDEIHHLPYDRFKERIETVKDQEAIDEWKAAMSKRLVYCVKNLAEGAEPIVLKNFVDVKKYFMEHIKSVAIKSADSFRVTGLQIDAMPRGIVKLSLLTLIEREKKFPLNMANNLRTKLKKAFFAIYKIGAKGVTYVTKIKRKFRVIGDTFEDKFQKIIVCLDTNQGLKLEDLFIKFSEKLSHEEKVLIEYSRDEFINNLTWLISEGFVSEHEDGKLFSTRILESIQIDKEDELLEDAQETSSHTDENFCQVCVSDQQNIDQKIENVSRQKISSLEPNCAEADIINDEYKHSEGSGQNIQEIVK